ncbi:MAG TPA: type I-U CRISPR-associated RAMP protein Csb1/Cas7u [Bryobacteraceae bacterium]|nr:type I-U CRISPR-associated RAMP protein Csb1/Cas7u [Bryobacteraceae bacterium]
MIDWTRLEKAPRILLEAELRPAQGGRFQPTGFADLGAAEYERPTAEGGVQKMLLVESAQSVANRLEQTGLDGDGPDIAPELKGLPYVAATLEGVEPKVRTSSLVEAHRLGSPYFLLNKQFKEKLAKEMAYNPKRPLDWKPIYATLFRYDPNSLLHGVFLSLLDGARVRAPRALTGFIEAEDVSRVISGGVKNSPVDPTGELQVADDSETREKGVYSNVPYPRIEYTAGRIKAYFNIDLALIHGYKLSMDAERLLVSLALLKIRRFLSARLRLRTACDLQLAADVKATAPEGFAVPNEEALLTAVQEGIVACKPLFHDPPVTEFVTKVKRKPNAEAARA